MKTLFTCLFVFSVCIVTAQRDYLPDDTSSVIHRTHYSTSYSANHKIAIWSAYRLDSSMLIKRVKRKTTFITDIELMLISPDHSDYVRSGYDRGHYISARNMQFSDTAQYESSYLINAGPQHPSFNKGIWLVLENRIRKWCKTDTLYISTGPILFSTIEQIGDSKVTVPAYYFKVLQKTNGESIGFVIPNRKSMTTDVFKYAVSVDYVENLTGIDFFTNIDIEEKEKTYNHKIWK